MQLSYRALWWPPTMSFARVVFTGINRINPRKLTHSIHSASAREIPIAPATPAKSTIASMSPSW
jgi:hypothetical protein